jgi:peptide/nickel transport system substrate-binding protein
MGGIRSVARHRPSRRLAGVIIVSVAGLVLAACQGAAASHGSSGGTPVNGGTASYADLQPVFTWMFPMENEANYEPAEGNVESDMWRPLYFAGGPGVTGINENLSLANPPVYSDHGRAVTITMKNTYKWSDGTPVTTKDIQFFFQLEAAGVKLGKYAAYIPGTMPDNISSITYQGQYQFTMHLKKSYNPAWFTGNQLTWLYPLPAHVWDKTCASCAVGNHAATLKGAEAVYNYLYAQSSQLSTYATNPLWKVVDGPWVISTYNAATQDCSFVANKAYTGPDKPHLHSFKIYTFSDDTAEIDALRSGIITYGFLPASDVPAAKNYESLGYTLKPYNAYYNEDFEFGFTSKTYGPLVRQLYIRQALQHLVNEPFLIRTALHGYGVPDYGIVPTSPTSSYSSPALKTDPYPYSISAADALLSSHGWVKNSSGTYACAHPGTAGNECGAGIAKGRPLTILMMYSTGVPAFLSEVESFQSTAHQAGINLSLDPQSTNTMFSIAGVCPPGPCNWGIAAYSGFMWNFGQYTVVPNGDQQFGKGNYWAGGYNSPTLNSLISESETKPGLTYLYQAENYISKQVASLWWPLPSQRILLVKNNLKGWSNLDPYLDELPSYWYYTK